MQERTCYTGRAATLSLLAAVAGGCSSVPAEETRKPTPPASDAELEALRETATDIERMLGQLHAAWYPDRDDPETAPDPPKGPLTTEVTLSWSGPIEPAVESVAHRIGFDFRRIGAPPARRVMVVVDADADTAYSVLRNLGHQADPIADVRVDTVNERVELIYRDDA